MDAFFTTTSFTASATTPEDIIDIVDSEKGYTPPLGYCTIA